MNDLDVATELATLRAERDAALAQRDEWKDYVPCEPCRRGNHDFCTGSCTSMCCALDISEKMVGELLATLERARAFAKERIENDGDWGALYEILGEPSAPDFEESKVLELATFGDFMNKFGVYTPPEWWDDVVLDVFDVAENGGDVEHFFEERISGLGALHHKLHEFQRQAEKSEVDGTTTAATGR